MSRRSDKEIIRLFVCSPKTRHAASEAVAVAVAVVHTVLSAGVDDGGLELEFQMSEGIDSHSTSATLVASLLYWLASSLTHRVHLAALDDRLRFGGPLSCQQKVAITSRAPLDFTLLDFSFNEYSCFFRRSGHLPRMTHLQPYCEGAHPQCLLARQRLSYLSGLESSSSVRSGEVQRDPGSPFSKSSSTNFSSTVLSDVGASTPFCSPPPTCSSTGAPVAKAYAIVRCFKLDGDSTSAPPEATDSPDAGLSRCDAISSSSFLVVLLSSSRGSLCSIIIFAPPSLKRGFVLGSLPRESPTGALAGLASPGAFTTRRRAQSRSSFPTAGLSKVVAAATLLGTLGQNGAASLAKHRRDHLHKIPKVDVFAALVKFLQHPASPLCVLNGGEDQHDFLGLQNAFPLHVQVGEHTAVDLTLLFRKKPVLPQFREFLLRVVVPLLLDLRLFHGSGDHADEQGEQNEGADHHEDDEVEHRAEGPRVRFCTFAGILRHLIAAVHVDVHDVRPVLQGGASEQRDERSVQRAEVPRIVAAEQHHADDGKEVEEQEEDEADEPDRGDAHDERLHDDLQLRQRLQELQDSHESQEAQHVHHAGVQGDASQDDEKVEGVPPTVEELVGLRVQRHQLHQDLQTEDGQDQKVKGGQGRSVLRCEDVVCADADENRRRENHERDEVAEGAGSFDRDTLDGHVVIPLAMRVEVHSGLQVE
eukprot:scaffold616_cov257-Pinguiococcus_pyrenoidosus.AAC.11